MQLGYTIIYVPDVATSLDFWQRAFGLRLRFVHDSGTYGELDTGATTWPLPHALGDSNFPGGHVAATRPLAPGV
jgi:catechol 2,3-dioxygenase-like lactoylglutathione lyase family enzyme